MYIENEKYVVFNGIEIYRKQMLLNDYNPLFYANLKFDNETIETRVMTIDAIQTTIEMMNHYVLGVINRERGIPTWPYEPWVIDKAEKAVDEFRDKQKDDK